jgi:AraC-like DNA-binding protein
MEEKKGVISLFQDELMIVKSLDRLPSSAAVKTGYNTAVLCRRGKIQIELGNEKQINLRQGQILLVPTNKLVQPLMVSTDVSASVVFISDHLLKSVLGGQIEIWNQAMYLEQTHVIDGAWIEGFQMYANGIFNARESHQLQSEIILSVLRTLFLMICEELMNQMGANLDSAAMASHDKVVFNNFLKLIASQKQKRQQVSFYASQLYITPKYLSAICKKVSGKTPLKWITESVMEDIYISLRETDMSIKQISQQLGFPNQSFFGQYFREQTGMTPADYRTKYRKGFANG